MNFFKPLKKAAKNEKKFLVKKTRAVFYCDHGKIKKFLLIFIMVFIAFFSFVIIAADKNLEKLAENIVIRIEKSNEFEKEIKQMVAGYPIEKMVPMIARQDKKVAAFMIGIAKKESNWGKRVPKLNGEDCFNYWGYRGLRERMGTGGHTCFDSPKDAVETVAKRIGYLVETKELDTPKEMIIWKCGSTCKGHSQSSVSKWISDVGFYFDKIY